ncbi:MAG: DUF3822 family protein [Bacteroidota bacterium]|nr:DUF3822 family protein [Bacteroidota bacterium]
MKKLFQIGDEEKIIHGSTLLCEWGDDYCCFSAYDQQTKTLQNLQYVTFDCLTDSISDNILQVIKKETEYNKILFCSCSSKAILTPVKVHHQHNPFLSCLYGEKNTVALHDVIPEWQLVNSYHFSTRLYQKILTAFPLACFLHTYTPFIKIYNGYVAESQIAVHFTPFNFRVIVKKEGQLQLAQMYCYQAPLDVVYYLLKIIQEIDLLKEDTFIILSGLIEQDSALFKELHQYFLNVHFALPGNVTLQNNKLPQHFFTSMYNLAACE